VLTAFYSRNEPRNKRFPSETKARIRSTFGEMADFLHALKRRDHTLAARLAQNWEATLFTHRVCGRILKERPDAPVFTIHDSVLTTPDSVGYVRSVILDEFARLGVTPSLKEERYG
jgi:hypothetical protein